MSNIPIKFTSTVFDIQTKKLLAKKKIDDLGEEKAKNIYNLLGINNYIAHSYEIRIIDEEPKDNLYLLHYINPGKDVNHIRGTVIHITEDGECKILAQSFPYSDDINVEELSNHNLTFDETYRVTEVYEGTVIRIYKGPITGEWYFSTHKKINGRKSKWSGPTFGDIFDSMWMPEEHKFDLYLKSDRCYIFILAHPENRLVCEFEPNIRLVGIYAFEESFNDGYSDDSKSKSTLCLEKKHPHVIIHNDTFSNLTNIEELKELVNSIPWKRSTGVFVYKLDLQQHKFVDYYKLSSSAYLDKRPLRGNEANLKLRYLEFKLENNDRLREFLDLFSESSYLFESVDKDFDSVISYLKKLFEKRYRHKRYCILPVEEHIVIENTSKNIDKTITLAQNIEKVLVRMCTARQINTMIKHMKEPPTTTQIKTKINHMKESKKQ